MLAPFQYKDAIGNMGYPDCNLNFLPPFAASTPGDEPKVGPAPSLQFLIDHDLPPDGQAPPEPGPEPEDDVLYSEAKFTEFVEAAAAIAEQYFGLPLDEGRQGAREMGDRFRGLGVNPTVWELSTGPRMRSGGGHVPTETLDLAVAEAIAEQQRLE